MEERRPMLPGSKDRTEEFLNKVGNSHSVKKSRKVVLPKALSKKRRHIAKIEKRQRITNKETENFLKSVNIVKKNIDRLREKVENIRQKQGIVFSAPIVRDEDYEELEKMGDVVYSECYVIQGQVKNLERDSASQFGSQRKMRCIQKEYLLSQLTQIMNEFRLMQTGYVEKRKRQYQENWIMSTRKDNINDKNTGAESNEPVVSAVTSKAQIKKGGKSKLKDKFSLILRPKSKKKFKQKVEHEGENKSSQNKVMHNITEMGDNPAVYDKPVNETSLKRSNDVEAENSVGVNSNKENEKDDQVNSKGVKSKLNSKFNSFRRQKLETKIKDQRCDPFEEEQEEEDMDVIFRRYSQPIPDIDLEDATEPPETKTPMRGKFNIVKRLSFRRSKSLQPDSSECHSIVEEENDKSSPGVNNTNKTIAEINHENTEESKPVAITQKEGDKGIENNEIIQKNGKSKFPVKFPFRRQKSKRDSTGSDVHLSEVTLSKDSEKGIVTVAKSNSQNCAESAELVISNDIIEISSKRKNPELSSERGQTSPTISGETDAEIFLRRPNKVVEQPAEVKQKKDNENTNPFLESEPDIAMDTAVVDTIDEETLEEFKRGKSRLSWRFSFRGTKSSTKPKEKENKKLVEERKVTNVDKEKSKEETVNLRKPIEVLEKTPEVKPTEDSENTNPFDVSDSDIIMETTDSSVVVDAVDEETPGIFKRGKSRLSWRFSFRGLKSSTKSKENGNEIVLQEGNFSQIVDKGKIKEEAIIDENSQILFDLEHEKSIDLGQEDKTTKDIKSKMTDKLPTSRSCSKSGGYQAQHVLLEVKKERSQISIEEHVEMVSIDRRDSSEVGVEKVEKSTKISDKKVPERLNEEHSEKASGMTLDFKSKDSNKTTFIDRLQFKKQKSRSPSVEDDKSQSLLLVDHFENKKVNLSETNAEIYHTEDTEVIEPLLQIDEACEVKIESHKSRQELNAIKKREERLKKLEQGIVEMTELHKEFHSIVESQGDTMNKIEYYVDTAQYNVEEGKEELLKAQKGTKKLRKRKIVCGIVIGVVLVIITFVVICIAAL